jgi:hypothetical protein
MKLVMVMRVEELAAMLQAEVAVVAIVMQTDTCLSMQIAREPYC